MSRRTPTFLSSSALKSLKMHSTNPPTTPSSLKRSVQCATPPPSPTSSPHPRRLKILYSPTFKTHRPPPGSPHPECPARLDSIITSLKSDPVLSPYLDFQLPQPITGEGSEERRALVMKYVREVHNENGYVDELIRLSRKGGGLDVDTYVAPGSFEVALLATSAWMEGVEMVVRGEEKGVWVLSRPPGHHALKGRGMGFCLLNHAAVAAKYGLELGIERVGVLDFDVHFGNGTADIVKGDERIRFVSSHQVPLFPGGGEEGTEGNVRYIELESGMGTGDGFMDRFDAEMVEWVKDSGLVVVSAGFDALDVDPLAGVEFKVADYRAFAEKIMKGVGEDTGVLFGLEGGYELGEGGVGEGVKECVKGFCFGKWGDGEGKDEREEEDNGGGGEGVYGKRGEGESEDKREDEDNVREGKDGRVSVS